MKKQYKTHGRVKMCLQDVATKHLTYALRWAMGELKEYQAFIQDINKELKKRKTYPNSKKLAGIDLKPTHNYENLHKNMKETIIGTMWFMGGYVAANPPKWWFRLLDKLKV